MRAILLCAVSTLAGGCGSDTEPASPTTTSSTTSASTGGQGGKGGDAGTATGGVGGGGGLGAGGEGGAGGGPAIDDCLRTEAGFTAGVPDAPVCAQPTCPDAACAASTIVTKGSDLQLAAAAATGGDCLVLEPGTYGAVNLPPGVSVLGRSAAEVTVGKITAAGDGVLVRGLTVLGGGIVMTGPGDITVDRVAVRQAPDAGVVVTDASATLLDSCIEASGDAGLYVSCAAGCGCVSPPTALVERTLSSKNASVGAWFEGAAVTLGEAMVVDTVPLNFAAGYGIYASGCATVSGSKVLLRDNASVGVVMAEVGGTLGPEITVQGNGGGIVACAVPAALGLSLSGFTVAGNDLVGIAIGGASSGVNLADGSIAGTTVTVIPTPGGGTAMVGDGIDWVGGSELVVAGTVSIQSSGRAPAVVDGSSNGSFDAMLGGGDDANGIFLQAGAAPQIGAGIKQTQADPPLDLPVYCP